MDPTHPVTIELAKELKEAYRSKTSDRKTEITPKGISQAAGTALTLKQEFEEGKLQLPDVIFVSSYVRPMQTLEVMQIVWPELRSIEVIREELLREQEIGVVHNYGDYEVFFALNPEQRELFELKGELGLYSYRFPGGENLPDVRLRARLWLKEAREHFGYKRIWAVSHFNWLLALRSEIGQLSAEECLALEKETAKINCAVTQYRQGRSSRENYGRLMVARYNKKLW